MSCAVAQLRFLYLVIIIIKLSLLFFIITMPLAKDLILLYKFYTQGIHLTYRNLILFNVMSIANLLERTQDPDSHINYTNLFFKIKVERWYAYRLVIRIVIFIEVGMYEGLLYSDTILGVKGQHTTQ